MSLLDSLNTEWLDLGQQPVSWSDCPALTDCRAADDALSPAAGVADEVLGYLIARHQGGDWLAGRTVLQTMLGKLVCLAHRAPADVRPHALPDLVAQMWIRIVTYPLDRRPRSIAANLWLDARKQAMAEWRPKEQATPEEALNWLLEEQDTTHQAEETTTAAELIREAARRGLLDDITTKVMLAFHGPEEPTSTTVGHRFGLSSENVRARCSLGRKRLIPMARDWVALELAA